MKRIFIFLFCIIINIPALYAAVPQINKSDWSVQMTESVMKRSPDSWNLDTDHKNEWEYTFGLVLKAILEVWQQTGNESYFQYVNQYYDYFIQENGNILTYDPTEYNIDCINPGKPLFELLRQTKSEKYKDAIVLLRSQMSTHPRTREGGFWHKKIYPHQMWLDGVYMASPFLAQFAQYNEEPELFDDVALQILLIEKHTRDQKTGLLYHGWDESRQQRWADEKSGCSPNFWGRAMGWYGMALVDVLDFFPEDHPTYKDIIAVLQRWAVAIKNIQDRESAVWYQVLDKGGSPVNYLESSASCMFVYTLAKGVRMGYLDPEYYTIAQKAYDGILEKFIVVDENGLVTIMQGCAVAGLGGNPYRDGSYNYYINTRIAENDPKAEGPFILASLEIEMKNNNHDNK